MNEQNKYKLYHMVIKKDNGKYVVIPFETSEYPLLECEKCGKQYNIKLPEGSIENPTQNQIYNNSDDSLTGLIICDNKDPKCDGTCKLIE